MEFQKGSRKKKGRVGSWSRRKRLQPGARLLYQGCWKGEGTRSVHAAPYDLVVKFLMARVKQEVLSSLNKISLGAFLSFPRLDCSQVLGTLCLQSSVCHEQETITFECCDGRLRVVLGFKIAVNCVQAAPARFSDSGIPLSRLLDAPTFPYFQVLEGTWTPGY